jgi:signal transduction histidine kinase
MDWSEGADNYAFQPLKSGESISKFFPNLTTTGNELRGLVTQPEKPLIFPRINQNQRFFSLKVYPCQALENNETGLICLLQDVSQQVELERKLEEQTHELEELTQMKSAFLAVASHELRAPLASAKGFLEMVLEGNFGALDERQEHFLKLAANNLERLRDLTNDLLDVERIENGLMPLDLSSFELGSLARVVGESMAEEAEKGRVKLNFEESSLKYRVYADMGRIEQVFTNLLSNAIKYSRLEGGEIIITFKIENGVVVTNIHDEGIGIEESDQQRLFQRFFRASNASSQGARGNGLGLSIVKAIVERHGGEVWLSSQINAGSTFSFSLPLAETETGSVI